MGALRYFWRRPVFILTALAIGGMALYADTFVRSDNFEGYWASTVSNATIFLIFSCGVSSASAAIAAARARRGGLWSMPTARSRVRISVRILWPAFVGGVVAQLFGLGLLIPSALGAPGRFPVEVCAAWLCILLFHTSLGFLIGRFLPMVASIPLAVFISYVWLGFTWALDYYPLRYLSGLVIVNCCSVNTRLDERAVTAVIAFSFIAALALFLTAVAPPVNLGRNRTSFSWIGTVAGVIVAVIVGLNIAHGLGPQPLQDRPLSEQRCSGSRPNVCLYPEQFIHSDPRPILGKAFKNLENQGISVPPTISGARGKSDAETLYMVISSKSTASLLVSSLASSLLPDELAPYCEDGTDYEDRVNVAITASWWLGSVAGSGQVPTSSITPIATTQDSAMLISRLSTLTPDEQRNWYEAAIPSLSACSYKPVAVPTS